MNNETKEQIRGLRLEGHTYSEIQSILGVRISKSTLSYICKNLTLGEKQKEKMNTKIQYYLSLAREKSSIAAKHRKEERLNKLLHKNRNLGKIIQRVDVAKVALAMLFLGEGSKTHTASVMFGNSSPEVIKLFLHFLRKCYPIEEEKLRCTVQCRADQNPEELKNFWLQITNIPLTRFYKTQIDPRTRKKPLKHIDYKGVCRIDYLSTDVVCDLNQSIKAIKLAGL